MQTETRRPDLVAVFKEHGAYVWRLARRLGVREADAEDVCQEVFVVIHRRLSDFEGRSSLRTWIYGITVRVASDYRKRAVHKREVLHDEVPDVIANDDPHGALSQRRALQMLDRILAELDDDKRAVFVLYEIEGLGMNEIAEALNLPLQTAYSRLHAARAFVTSRAKQVEQAGAAPS